MALFYADTSALVKLVRDEPESAALRTFLDRADVVTSELVLAELPRAVRRATATALGPERARLLARAEAVLEAVALVAIDRPLLLGAGALDEPSLRTLDAVHLAAALFVEPTDGFVGYDERQSAAARLAGLRTYSPGA